MDILAFGVLVVGGVGYYLSKKQPIYLLIIGFGAGLLAGAMWADGIRPGPTVQARMGSLAEFRAKNNPF